MCFSTVKQISSGLISLKSITFPYIETLAYYINSRLGICFLKSSHLSYINACYILSHGSSSSFMIDAILREARDKSCSGVIFILFISLLTQPNLNAKLELVFVHNCLVQRHDYLGPTLRN